VDETPIKVDRGWGALYRALAREGHLLDVRLSEPRDLPAARALSRSARPSTTGSPLRVTTDRHGSYPGAIRQEVGPAITHRTTREAKDLVEQRHRAIKQRPRSRLGVKRLASAARFCQAYDGVPNFLRFHPIGHRPAP
jgi:putative transposase